MLQRLFRLFQGSCMLRRTGGWTQAWWPRPSVPPMTPCLVSSGTCQRWRLARPGKSPRAQRRQVTRIPIPTCKGAWGHAAWRPPS